MCGRYTLQDAQEFLEHVFKIFDVPEFIPRYNIAPTQQVAAVRKIANKNQLAFLRWGLIPFWAKDITLSARMINARAESVYDKPSFKAAYKKRRCLIIADGFYEWERVNGKKQPYYFQLKNSQPFAFAGLWEKWNKTKQTIESCTIITTTANELMSSIHERMPVIIDSNDYEMWLDSSFDDINILNTLLRPYPDSKMKMHPVNDRVNSPIYDFSECIAPLVK
ncbi:MAG: SOS response-associated peptidase [Cyanobacteriota bacterium]